MNMYAVAAVWIGMAFAASLISVRLGIAAALVEIVIGVVAGNVPFLAHHVQQTPYTDFLAGLGSIILIFLAGAEIDPHSLRRHLKASVTIGVLSFLVPFLGAFAFCYLVLGWSFHAAEIGGLALSTTSVAVVYAMVVETGLNREPL